MEIEKLINKLETICEDKKVHYIDVFLVDVKDIKTIIEYLKQLKKIYKNI